MTLAGEAPRVGDQVVLHHPSADWRHAEVVPSRVERLLVEVMRGGNIIAALPTLAEIRSGLRARLGDFDGTYLRGLNPHVYKVSISQGLRDLKLELIERGLREHRHIGAAGRNA
jgi:nicotinate phosphoribosyltransferase